MAFENAQDFIDVWTELDAAYGSLPTEVNFGDYSATNTLDTTGDFTNTLAEFGGGSFGSVDYSTVLDSSSAVAGDVGLAVNALFVEMGNAYVDWLNDGNAPILDIAQDRGGDPAPGQSYHDNLLGNLRDGTIANRFTDEGLSDPRSSAAQEFGDRPYFGGSSDNITYGQTIAWDIAHGIDASMLDVDRDGDAPLAGEIQLVTDSGVTGYGSIEAAVDAASNEDTIVLGSGPYNLSDTLEIDKSLEIIAGGEPGSVTLNGPTDGSVVAVMGNNNAGDSSGVGIDSVTLDGLNLNPASGQFGFVSLSNLDPAGFYDVGEVTLRDVSIDTANGAASGASPVGLFDVQTANLESVTINGITAPSGTGLVEAVGVGTLAVDEDTAITNGGETIGINIFTVPDYAPNARLAIADGVDYSGTDTPLRDARTDATTHVGSDAADQVSGGSGDEFYFGDAGDDTIAAGAGDDEIKFSSGDDTVNGGAGIDTLRVLGSPDDYTIDPAGGTVTRTSDGATTTFSGIEVIEASSTQEAFNLDFSDPADVDFGASDALWDDDRTAVDSFTINNDFGGRDVLEINMDESGDTDGFHRYQGAKYKDPSDGSWDGGDGSVLSYDFYIDPTWSGDDQSQASGVWSVMENDSDDITTYSILEYQDAEANEDGAATFRVYTQTSPGSYGWVDAGLPSGFDASSGGWVDVEFEFNEGAGFTWSVNGEELYTDQAAGYDGATTFKEFIVNSPNFGNDETYRYDNFSLQAGESADDTSKTILVGGDSAYSTIQAAIDAASDGDTVKIGAGTFTGDVTVDKDVTIEGAQVGVAGDDSGRGLNAASESVIAGQVTVTADDATLDGLAFDTDASGVGGGGAVLDINADDTTAQNLYFATTAPNGVSPAEIGLSGSGSVVTGNLIDRSASAGEGSQGNPSISGQIVSAEITGNTIVNGQIGLVANGGSSDTVTVTGNDVTASDVVAGRDAIWLTGPSFGPVNDGQLASITIESNAIAGDSGVQINGTSQADNLSRFATNGNDLQKGHGGNDRLVGSAGDDRLSGGLGSDTLAGGGGADTISGTPDELDGDRINGFSPQDTLYVNGIANLTADHLQAQGNTLTIDADKDGAFSSDGDAEITVNGAINNLAVANSDDDQDSLITFNVASGGGGGAGGGGAGGGGAGGGAGPDLTPGNDNADGNDGSETLPGGEGNDTVSGNNGNDEVYGNQGEDEVYGNQGDDLVFGGQDNDLAFGGQDNDQVYGNKGDDEVYGNQGDDDIFGGQENDDLFGGQDGDLIYGNLGDDRIYGNVGNDTLYGGEGDDEFAFLSGDGQDTVADFGDGDTISLAADINGTGVQSFADLTITENENGDAVIDLGGDNSLTVQGVSPDALSESDFSFF